MDLTQILGSTDSVTWWQECARTVVVFCYGLAVVRLAGRRVFGKWSGVDFIVSIIVGPWRTPASTTLIMLLHWILAHAAARFERLSPARPRQSRPLRLPR
jgi:uncharacterized membrane protein YcaP (DUF421 family)